MVLNGDGNIKNLVEFDLNKCGRDSGTAQNCYIYCSTSDVDGTLTADDRTRWGSENNKSCVF